MDDSDKIQPLRLTQFSHGAGCGCKIAPAVLEEILQTTFDHQFPGLLVGNNTKDDAAVFDTGNGQCILSTTDFFMPIVDDAYDFGRIASVNALSDIYAMGGKPLMAISILGWPVNKIPASAARKVLEGSRQVCTEAGIPLAGGHSIDSPEPIFGLAVTGIADKEHIKTNNRAKPGSLIYLTKPLGTGIITTAQKKGKVSTENLDYAIASMLKLNSIGAELGKLDMVEAMTDITGFGLLGHLLEICEGSGVSASIDLNKIPLMPGIREYISAGCIPGGTARNFESYGQKVSAMNEETRQILCDPQTSGGLLIVVQLNQQEEFENLLAGNHTQSIFNIGQVTLNSEKVVTVLNG